MKRLIFTVVLSAMLLNVHTQNKVNSTYADKIGQIRNFIRFQMEQDHIPGLSVGFYIGDFQWTEGFGLADVENNVPATAHSSYRLASNTKSMTALAAMQLAEDGKLDPDADIRNYVPWFPRKHWPVTARQLMGHLSGISHYRNPDTESHIKVHKDTRESLDIFDDFQLVYEPGTHYLYSSYGYNLLGAVVEVAAGQPFGDYLEEHIWRPLGMDETCMDSPENIIPDRVRGYRLVFGKLKNSEYVDMSSRFAAGGTRSTVPDLLKYAKSYQNHTILSVKDISLMETSMATRNGYYTSYGMGWKITPVNGHFIAMHTGSQNETRTILIRIPAMRAAIALAYNFEGAGTSAYGHRIYQILFGEPWNRPVYSNNKEDDAVCRAIRDVFNYGLAQYDRYGKPVTSDPESLKEAFGWFGECVNPDSLNQAFVRTTRKIRDGRHPIASDAFVKVGSFMASRLQTGKNYHQAGAPVFFADYIRYCKAGNGIPEEYRFPEPFEKTVLKWESDWIKVWNDPVRTTFIAPYNDPVSVLEKLSKIFYGAAIYPDYSTDILYTARTLILSGKSEQALELAGIAGDIYPDMAMPHIVRAFAFFITDKEDKGIAAFRKAQQAEKGSAGANASVFTGFAHALINMNQLTKALEILHTGEKLFPGASTIYETRADIYRELSRRNYRKALDENPSNQRIWKKMKKAG